MPSRQEVREIRQTLDQSLRDQGVNWFGRTLAQARITGLQTGSVLYDLTDGIRMIDSLGAGVGTGLIAANYLPPVLGAFNQGIHPAINIAVSAGLGVMAFKISENLKERSQKAWDDSRSQENLQEKKRLINQSRKIWAGRFIVSSILGAVTIRKAAEWQGILLDQMANSNDIFFALGLGVNAGCELVRQGYLLLDRKNNQQSEQVQQPVQVQEAQAENR